MLSDCNEPIREVTCCRKPNGHVTNCPVARLHAGGMVSITDDDGAVVRMTVDQFDALLDLGRDLVREDDWP